MARHRNSRKPEAGCRARPIRMHALLDEYLVWMQTQNFSDDTREHAARLRRLLPRLVPGARPGKPHRDHAARAGALSAGALPATAKRTAQPLTFRTQNSRLRALKGWFRWLARQNYILHNPASELMLPRLENRLPKYILTRRGSRAGDAAARHHRRPKACAIAPSWKPFTRPACGAWKSRT